MCLITCFYHLAIHFNISMLGHQTMLDDVWSPNIFHLDSPLGHVGKKVPLDVAFLLLMKWDPVLPRQRPASPSRQNLQWKHKGKEGAKEQLAVYGNSEQWLPYSDVGNLSANCRPTGYRHITDRLPTGHQLSANTLASNITQTVD